MKKLLVTIIGTFVVTVAFAGGELPRGASAPEPVRVFKPRDEQKRLGPPAGDQTVCREAPLPAPYRPIGWGKKLHEKYGPTYYYPSERAYEGLNPTYYPFFHPRLWPNYKAPAQYPRNHFCGSSRSGWYWDEYDDWVRGGRYEERQ